MLLDRGEVDVDTTPLSSSVADHAVRTSRATRNLCVGAYLDKEFRRRVLSDVYGETRKAFAPSYGFDAVPVIGHCKRAERLLQRRDLTILLLLLLWLLAERSAMIIALLVLVLWGLAVAILDIILEVVGLTRPLRRVLRGQAVIIIVGIVALVISVPIFFPALLTQFADALRLWGPGAPDWIAVADAGSAVRPSTLGVVLLIALLYVAVASEALARQLTFEALGRWTYIPVPSDGTSRLNVIARQQQGNVTQYAGFRPFVGAGLELRTWSFAQRLVREESLPWTGHERDREFEELPFQAEALVGYLREQLSSLGDSSSPEVSLPGLRVRDHVFQPAEDADDLVHTMEEDQLSTLIADPAQAARHYLTCEVSSWDGEVVSTMFVHVAVQGRTLYTELSAWLLPPTRSEFHLLHNPRNLGLTARVRSLGGALVRVTPTVLLTPFRFLDTILVGLRAAIRTAMEPFVQVHDIGVRVSIRELGAVLVPQVRPDGPAFLPESYFQSHDAIKYWKILERRLVAAVLDFLEDKHVDTSEYRQRAVQILNTGVIQFGGTMSITASAIGPGARAGDRGEGGPKNDDGKGPPSDK